MALSGELSDLSLAELIEFFCNQRKTGRLKVTYPDRAGYFFVQAGALVDARIGTLRGIEAVYYALTLPNASFKFSAAFEAPQRTINQPWLQVVLEGFRRMDEGRAPSQVEATRPSNEVPAERKAKSEVVHTTSQKDDYFAKDGESVKDELVENIAVLPTASPIVLWKYGSARSKPLLFGAVVAAVVASVAAIGFPAGWYTRSSLSADDLARQEAATLKEHSSNEVSNSPDSGSAAESRPDSSAKPSRNEIAERAAQFAIQRAREAERVRLKLRENQLQATPQQPATAQKQEPPRQEPRAVTVQVTYDEAGRVTQASGGDAAALRIARQKRFPAGKAGSSTVTIPIN